MKTRHRRLILIGLLIVAVMASAVYWIMRVRDIASPVAPAVSIPIATQSAPIGATEALFGTRPELSMLGGSLQVRGVVLAPNAVESIAILVDSGKARAYRIGTEVVPGVHLSEVHRRYVVVSDGTNSTRIDIPEPTKNQAPAADAVAPTEAAPVTTSTLGGMRGEPPHTPGNPDQDQPANDTGAPATQ